jgi:tRNA threonylcarbamoyl adenosine modification protein YjeE
VITRCLQDVGQQIEDIPSPSFTLVQSYSWPSEDDPGREIWHIDLWRVDSPEELVELGFEEAIGRHAMLIEWPDRLGAGLPDDALHLNLAPDDDGTARVITLTASSPDWEDRLSRLAGKS